MGELRLLELRLEDELSRFSKVRGNSVAGSASSGYLIATSNQFFFLIYSLKNIYHSVQDCSFLDQIVKVVKQEAIDLSGITFVIVCCNEATVTIVRGSFICFK